MTIREGPPHQFSLTFQHFTEESSALNGPKMWEFGISNLPIDLLNPMDHPKAIAAADSS
ncbi:hypothetical protein NG793_03775 [Laspinema sp. C5]|nr:hypothetical protein [Laspinema sp. D3c]